MSDKIFLKPLSYITWYDDAHEIRANSIMQHVCLSDWYVNVEVTAFVCKHDFSYPSQRTDPIELRELHTQFMELKKQYANKN